MKRSIAISIAFHSMILGVALFSLPAVDAFKAPPVDAIQVDISQITDVSKRKSVTTEAVEKPVKPAPKKTVTALAQPVEKPAEVEKTSAKSAAPPPEEKPPEPKKEEPKKVEEMPLDSDPLKQLLADEALKEAKQKESDEKKKVDDKKKADAKKKVDEKKKLEKAEAKKKADEKKKFEDKLAEAAAFLDKSDDERAAPVKSVEPDGSPETAERNLAGADDAISATIVDALVSKVKECFTVPPAARDADITVRVRFTLAEDGTVTSVKAEPNSDPIAGATAAAAVSAIKGCEPYELPPDRYDLWKDVILDFNPNMLFRT